MEAASFDYLFKVRAVGERNIGKTSTIQRFVDDVFQEGYPVLSIGVDFRIKAINYDNKVIKLQLWDIHGSERYRTITASQYRGLHGVLLMYDVTNRSSFDVVGTHLDIIQQYAPKECITILLGNKIDAEETRRVTFAEGSDLADRLGLSFFEISAKSGYSVNEALTELISLMVKTREGKVEKKDPKDSDYIQKLKEMSKTESKEKVCF